MVERELVELEVAGSIPVAHPEFQFIKSQYLFGFLRIETINELLK